MPFIDVNVQSNKSLFTPLLPIMFSNETSLAADDTECFSTIGTDDKFPMLSKVILHYMSTIGSDMYSAEYIPVIQSYLIKQSEI